MEESQSAKQKECEAFVLGLNAQTGQNSPLYQSFSRDPLFDRTLVPLLFSFVYGQSERTESPNQPELPNRSHSVSPNQPNTKK